VEGVEVDISDLVADRIAGAIGRRMLHASVPDLSWKAPDGRAQIPRWQVGGAPPLPPLYRHPGLEPGSIPQSHERLNHGPRLKAGVTGEVSIASGVTPDGNSWMAVPSTTMTITA
jgi:hypothetical protein